MTALLTPAYKLTRGIGGGSSQVVDTTQDPQASALVALTVRLDLDSPADSATLVFGRVGGLQLEREDEVTLELGYTDDGADPPADTLTQVLTGAVVSLDAGLTQVRAIVHSAASSLLTAFIDQTYEDMNAGDIIRDLGNRAGVPLGTIDDGIDLPAYVVDGRRATWHHLRDLADLSGVDAYINADGELTFEAFTGGKAVHVYEYAKHVLELEIWRRPARAGQVEVWGESASGQGGDEAWAWLTKDFGQFKGSAGQGQPTLLLERPALRTSAAAAAAATAAQRTIARQVLRGRLLGQGRPQVKLGDAIQLRGLSEQALNTNFQVRAVTHRLTKAGGFTTEVEFRANTP
jgi:hypothetical protein